MLEYIPEQFRPNYEQHSNEHDVYRLVLNTDCLSYEDFLPSFLEEGYRMKNKQDDYSVSLFVNKKTLLTLRMKFDVLKKYNGIAIGNTSNERGISIKNNEHVNYFLFDYVNNSPCSDFTICEVLEK